MRAAGVTADEFAESMAKLAEAERLLNARIALHIRENIARELRSSERMRRHFKRQRARQRRVTLIVQVSDAINRAVDSVCEAIEHWLTRWFIMGWAYYGEINGRPVGYSVEAVCDHPECKTIIDRGLSYVCGNMHGDNCGGYFCADHLHRTGNPESSKACAACLKELQRTCEECGEDEAEDHNGKRLCQECARELVA